MGTLFGYFPDGTNKQFLSDSMSTRDHQCCYHQIHCLNLQGQNKNTQF